MVRWRQVAQWYAVAAAGPAVAGALWWLAGAGQLAHVVFGAAAMLSPLGATVWAERVAPGALALPWRPRPTRSWLAASALGLVIPALAWLATPLWPGAGWDGSMAALFERLAAAGVPAADLAGARAQLGALPVHPALWMLPQVVVAGATINALFAFGEEIGWRGWLHRELAPLGFWRAAVVGGVMWGLWHAPLILVGHNYAADRGLGVLLFTAICVGLAPVHAAVREATGAVWAAAVLHGTINAAAGAVTLFARGPELWIGVQGGAGLVALVAVNVGVAALRAHR